MKSLTFWTTVLALWGIAHGRSRQLQEPSTSFLQNILERTRTVLRKADQTIRSLVKVATSGLKGTTVSATKVLDFGFKFIGKLASLIAQLPSLLMTSAAGEAIKVIHDVVETYLRLTEILGVAGGARQRRSHTYEYQTQYSPLSESTPVYQSNHKHPPKMRPDPYGFNSNMKYQGGQMGYYNPRF